MRGEGATYGVGIAHSTIKTVKRVAKQPLAFIIFMQPKGIYAIDNEKIAQNSHFIYK